MANQQHRNTLKRVIVLKAFTVRDQFGSWWRVQQGSIGDVVRKNGFSRILFTTGGTLIQLPLKSPQRCAALEGDVQQQLLISPGTIVPVITESFLSPVEQKVFRYAKERVQFNTLLYVLKHASRKELSPPRLEKLVRPIYEKYIAREYYEICSKLCAFLYEYRTAHLPGFKKRKTLSAGWQWLYQLREVSEKVSLHLVSHAMPLPIATPVVEPPAGKQTIIVLQPFTGRRLYGELWQIQRGCIAELQREGRSTRLTFQNGPSFLTLTIRSSSKYAVSPTAKIEPVVVTQRGIMPQLPPEWQGREGGDLLFVLHLLLKAELTVSQRRRVLQVMLHESIQRELYDVSQLIQEQLAQTAGKTR